MNKILIDVVVIVALLMAAFTAGYLYGERQGENSSCEKYIQSYNKALDYIDEQRKQCGIIFEIPTMKGGNTEWKLKTFTKNPL